MHVAKSLSRAHKNGPFSTRYMYILIILSSLRRRLRYSYRDAPPFFARDRALYLTAIDNVYIIYLCYSLPRPAAIVFAPDADAEDSEVSFFLSPPKIALVTTRRPDNVLRHFSLHALIRSPAHKSACTWKCTWECTHAHFDVSSNKVSRAKEPIKFHECYFMIGSMQ